MIEIKKKKTAEVLRTLISFQPYPWCYRSCLNPSSQGRQQATATNSQKPFEWAFVGTREGPEVALVRWQWKDLFWLLKVPKDQVLHWVQGINFLDTLIFPSPVMSPTWRFCFSSFVFTVTLYILNVIHLLFLGAWESWITGSWTSNLDSTLPEAYSEVHWLVVWLVVVNICNPRTQEQEAKESGVQGYTANFRPTWDIWNPDTTLQYFWVYILCVALIN